MLKFDEKTNLNKISLTGVRSIALIGLLCIAPRSIKEIRKAFIEMKIMADSHSDDILRIDLNTIKAMGCEISRSSAKTQFKYILTKHPFMLNLTKEDVKYMKRGINKIKNSLDVDILILYHNLIKKLSEYITNETVKEYFLGISPLKHYNINKVTALRNDCHDNKTLSLIYKKTQTEPETEKKIIAQKLKFQNDKLYLCGYNIEKKALVVLNVKRIKKILSNNIEQNCETPKPMKIKFFIKNYMTNAFSNEETVLEEKDNGYIVEGEYFNEFFGIQRILSFGADCTVLEPCELKDKIISKLRGMKKIYAE